MGRNKNTQYFNLSGAHYKRIYIHFVEVPTFCWSGVPDPLDGLPPPTPPTRIRPGTINVRCSLVSSRGTIIVHASQYILNILLVNFFITIMSHNTTKGTGQMGTGNMNPDAQIRHKICYKCHNCVLQNSNTACMIRLIDTECVCLECTLIVLRNNLHIPIETYVRTYHGSTESANSILRVHDILIKLIN